MGTLFLVVKGSVGAAWKAIVTINQALGVMIKLWKTATYPARLFFSLLKTSTGVAVTGIKKVYDILKTVTSFISDMVIGALTGVKDLVWDIATRVFTKLKQAVSETASKFLEFEKEADRAFGLIAGRGKASFREVQDAALRVSSEVGKDLIGVTKGLFEVISKGFRDVAEAEEVLMAAAKLAHAGWIGVDEAVSVVITTMGSYGVAAGEAQRIIELLYETQIQGRGTMAQFAHLLGNVLPIASATGYALEDAAAATAGITKVMGQHGRVMFSVVAALRHIEKPTKTTAQAWLDYEYAVKKTAEGHIDFVASVDELRRIRKKANAEGKDAIKDMFKHQAALRGISILTNLSEKEWREVTSAMRDAKLQMKDFDISTASTSTRIVRALEMWKVRFENLKVVIFRFFADAFKPIFDDIVLMLQDTYSEFKKLGGTGVFESLEASLSKLVQQFRESEFWREVLQSWHNHIGRVIKAIEWLTVELNLLAENGTIKKFFDSLPGKLQDIWDELKRVGSLVKDEILVAFENWGEAWGALEPSFVNGLNTVITLLESFMGPLEEIDTNFWRMIKETIPKWIATWEEIDVESIVGGWLQKFNEFRQDMVPLWGEIGDAISGALNIVSASLEVWALGIKTLGKTLIILQRGAMFLQYGGDMEKLGRLREEHAQKIEQIEKNIALWREKQARGQTGGLLSEDPAMMIAKLAAQRREERSGRGAEIATLEKAVEPFINMVKETEQAKKFLDQLGEIPSQIPFAEIGQKIAEGMGKFGEGEGQRLSQPEEPFQKATRSLLFPQMSSNVQSMTPEELSKKYDLSLGSFTDEGESPQESLFQAIVFLLQRMSMQTKAEQEANSRRFLELEALKSSILIEPRAT